VLICGPYGPEKAFRVLLLLLLLLFLLLLLLLFPAIGLSPGGSSPALVQTKIKIQKQL
jgi:hypothetical protein